MEIYKKQQKNMLIFSILVLLTLASLIVLTLVLDLSIIFKGIAIVGFLLSITLGILLVEPKYRQVTNKLHRAMIIQNKNSPFLTETPLTSESFKTFFSNTDFELFEEKNNMITFSKLERKGSVAMQKPTRATLVIYLLDDKIDFFHPEIGITLASFNEKHLKSEKGKDFSIIIFRNAFEFTDDLIEDADKVMFFSQKQDQMTQVNVLLTPTEAYLLENNSFYPTPNYQELSLLVHQILKGV